MIALSPSALPLRTTRVIATQKHLSFRRATLDQSPQFVTARVNPFWKLVGGGAKHAEAKFTQQCRVAESLGYTVTIVIKTDVVSEGDQGIPLVRLQRNALRQFLDPISNARKVELEKEISLCLRDWLQCV